jgi:hypothetical protein
MFLELPLVLTIHLKVCQRVPTYPVQPAMIRI